MTRRWLFALFIFTGLVGALPAMPMATAGTGGWTIQPTANPAGANYSTLTGVACPSPTVCTAVGYYTAGTSATFALVETWNGSRWTLQPTQKPAGATNSSLSGVACPSPTVCTAVGYYTAGTSATFALVETWNGSRWTIKPTPKQPGASLSGIACTAPNACTAVGYYSTGASTSATLVETWNGSRWTIQPTPNPPSGPNPIGGPSILLNGVACAARTACTAVGEHVNRSGPSGLSMLVEHWNGSGWRLQPIPKPAGATNSSLSGVACPSPTVCAAVGVYRNSRSGSALVEVWNGSRWTIVPTPNAAGETYSQLNGVACSVPNACTAVGIYSNSRGAGALVEVWNGSRWTNQRAANPPGAFASYFSGVACPSRTACTAVGDYTSGPPPGGHVTLAESRKG